MTSIKFTPEELEAEHTSPYPPGTLPQDLERTLVCIQQTIRKWLTLSSQRTKRGEIRERFIELTIAIASALFY